MRQGCCSGKGLDQTETTERWWIRDVHTRVGHFSLSTPTIETVFSSRQTYEEVFLLQHSNAWSMRNERLRECENCLIWNCSNIPVDTVNIRSYPCEMFCWKCMLLGVLLWFDLVQASNDGYNNNFTNLKSVWIMNESAMNIHDFG